MAKVITFSRTFPSYHPKAGEPTYFVEKIYRSYSVECLSEVFALPVSPLDIASLNAKLPFEIVDNFYKSLISWGSKPGEQPILKQKHHTIRAGHRFKVGEMFSPRVWSGKPYNSKQIIIAPDIKIDKIWSFKIIVGKKQMHILLNGEQVAADTLGIIAHHDGLSFVDFMHWFKYPGTAFEGQIICWNENIDY